MPASQTITAPRRSRPPDDALEVARRPSAWSSTCTARRLTRGSVDGPLRHRPRAQHAVDLEPEVVVQPGGGVLLDDEDGSLGHWPTYTQPALRRAHPRGSARPPRSARRGIPAGTRPAPGRRPERSSKSRSRDSSTRRRPRADVAGELAVALHELAGDQHVAHVRRVGLRHDRARPGPPGRSCSAGRRRRRSRRPACRA